MKLIDAWNNAVRMARTGFTKAIGELLGREAGVSRMIRSPRGKSHGLRLHQVGDYVDRHGRRVTIVTHVEKGRRWAGPGITGSVRRSMARRAVAETTP